MTENKCMECENGTMLEYAEIVTENDKLKEYIDILEQSLEIKEKINEFWYNEYKEMRNKLRIYKESNKG